MINIFIRLAIFIILFFISFKVFAEEKIIKKIIKAKHVYGLNHYDNELYLSHVFSNYVSKINIKNYNLKKLQKLTSGWQVLNFSENSADLYGVHSIEFIDKNRIIFLSYTEKIFFIYDFNKKEKIIYNEINKFLKGPSHIFFDLVENNLLVSDYDGGEVYLFNIQNQSIQKLSNLLNLRFEKPHMTIINNNKYYILDTKLKKIIIADRHFNLIGEISDKSVFFNQTKKRYQKKFLETPVSIKIDSVGNHYISDVGENNCIYIINKNMQLEGVIENMKILKKDTVYNLKNLHLDKIYDLNIVNNYIFISSTHTGKIFQIKNVFVDND